MLNEFAIIIKHEGNYSCIAIVTEEVVDSYIETLYDLSDGTCEILKIPYDYNKHGDLMEASSDFIAELVEK